MPFVKKCEKHGHGIQGSPQSVYVCAESFKKASSLSFGRELTCAKNAKRGRKVARLGWVGKVHFRPELRGQFFSAGHEFLWNARDAVGASPDCV